MPPLLLLARVVGVVLLDVHFVATLTNVLPFAKVVHKRKTFTGLPARLCYDFLDFRVILKAKKIAMTKAQYYETRIM